MQEIWGTGSQWKGSNWREKVEVSLNWMQETDEELELPFILVQCLRQISLSLLLFNCLVVTDSLWPHALRHTRLPSLSPSPWACPNSCPLNQWCRPTISSSVVPFFSCLQSFPASRSFQMSQFFVSSGQNIGISVSASALSMDIQGCFL